MEMSNVQTTSDHQDWKMINKMSFGRNTNSLQEVACNEKNWILSFLHLRKLSEESLKRILYLRIINFVKNNQLYFVNLSREQLQSKYKIFMCLMPWMQNNLNWSLFSRNKK